MLQLEFRQIGILAKSLPSFLHEIWQKSACMCVRMHAWGGCKYVILHASADKFL